MKATEIRAHLSVLGWSQRDLAGRLGCSPELVQRWCRDAKGYEMPDALGDWLSERSRFVTGKLSADAWLTRREADWLRNPPPDEWRSGRGKPAKENTQ